MKFLTALFTTTVFAFTGQVAAHNDEYLDSIATPHGGQMRMAGAYHLELVVGTRELTVYVTDHAGQLVFTSGADGSAVVLVGRNRIKVALEPDGDNRLKGSGEFVMDESMRVVLSVTLAGQGAEQARFTPFAPRTPNPNTAASGGQGDHYQH